MIIRRSLAKFSLLLLVIFLASSKLTYSQPFTDTAVVSLVNNLVFGNVLPGIPVTISKRSTFAAEFLIQGTAGSDVFISFTLPKYMTTTGNYMRTIFKTTDCAMDSSATPDQAAPTLDDVSPWRTTTYTIGSNSELTVWLGGTVVPDLVQQAGGYTADIVIFVEPVDAPGGP